MGGFGIGLTEFVIMGLLPEVSADFEVSESVAGYLISGYALVRRDRGHRAHRGRHPVRPQEGAAGADGAVHRRQPAVGAGPDVRGDDGRTHPRSPVPRRVLRHRLGRRRRPGAREQAGRRDRDDVRRTDHRQRSRRPVRHAARPAVRLALHVLGHHRHRRRGADRHRDAGAVRIPSGDAPASGGLRTELRRLPLPQVWFSIAVTILGFGGMFGAFTYIAFTLTEVGGFAVDQRPVAARSSSAPVCSSATSSVGGPPTRR